MGPHTAWFLLLCLTAERLFHPPHSAFSLAAFVKMSGDLELHVCAELIRSLGRGMALGCPGTFKATMTSRVISVWMAVYTRETASHSGFMRIVCKSGSSDEPRLLLLAAC